MLYSFLGMNSYSIFLVPSFKFSMHFKFRGNLFVLRILSWVYELFGFDMEFVNQVNHVET